MFRGTNIMDFLGRKRESFWRPVATGNDCAVRPLFGPLFNPDGRVDKYFTRRGASTFSA